MIQVLMYQAENNLPKLTQLTPTDEDVIITQQSLPVMRLVALPESCLKRRIGGAREAIKFISEDFDASLTDFHI